MRLLGGIICFVLFSVTLFSESYMISWPLMMKHTPKGDRIDVPLNSGMHRLIFDSQTPYDYGDKVRIVGETAVCSEPRNPGEFNFCAWQYREGIKSMMFITSHELVQASTKHAAFIWLSRLPQRLYHQMQLVFPNQSSVIYTMIFGAREDHVSSDVKSVFSKVGLIHLLVVSGAQIGLITAVVFLLMRLIHVPFIGAFFMVLMVQCWYLFISGIDASIARSVIMTDLLLWHRFYMLRRYPLWWYLVIAAVIIAVVMPKSVLSPGFWYSFFITYGLLMLPPRMVPLISGPRWFVAYGVASLTAVMISIPIQLIQTSTISLMAVVANLWVSWMSTWVLLGGLVCLVVSILSVDLGHFLGRGIDFLAAVMIRCAYVIDALGAQVSFDQVTILAFLISGGLIILFYYQRKKIILIGFILGWVMVFFHLSNRQFVLAIDVGQGDATLIVDGFYSVLIDSGGMRGGRPVAEHTILPVLNYFGIDQLSLLIITHHDLDHMGGLSMLLERGLDHIISPDTLPLTNHRHAEDIQLMPLPHGQLRVIPPSMFFLDESRNNQSLLIQLSVSNWSFLFTGDMDEWMEIRFINHHLVGSYHFLKLGHHGSRSSTSTELLMTVDPVLSWNSCGQNNPYGHPHSDVLNRLSKHHIPLLSTHVDGAIFFKINRSKVMVSTHVSNKVLLVKK